MDDNIGEGVPRLLLNRAISSLHVLCFLLLYLLCVCVYVWMKCNVKYRKKVGGYIFTQHMYLRNIAHTHIVYESGINRSSRVEVDGRVVYLLHWLLRTVRLKKAPRTVAYRECTFYLFEKIFFFLSYMIIKNKIILENNIIEVWKIFKKYTNEKYLKG